MKFSKQKLSVLFGAIALLAVFVCVQMVRADTGSDAAGYAWSSNIGWIKLNDCDDPSDSSTCTPTASYGVNILPVAPGTIAGYAWSSNIGWINFDASVGCPTTGCTPGAYADWNNPNADGSINIKGWARACSVYVNGCSGAIKPAASLGTCDTASSDTDPACEWDGYVALDSGSAGGSGGTWGLTIGKDNTIDGYAWGSQVIGWIKSITAKFVPNNNPAVTLVANPGAITNGDSSVLTATAANIDGTNACTFTTSDGSTAPTITMTQNGALSWKGTVSVTPPHTIVYTITCTKGIQSAKASATVTVTYISTPSTNPGGGSGNGGYCAVNNPQFSWDSDGTSCKISEQGGSSVGVASSSQAAGGSLGTDGLYYASVNLPVTGSSATYTLQCTGGTQTKAVTVLVNACQKDFSISGVPNSPASLILNADAKTMSETYTISITPQYGFNSTVSLSTILTGLPKDAQSSFDTTTLSPDSNGKYGTAQLTITVGAGDVKQTVNYPFLVQGVGGTFTRQASLTAGATVPIKPIFQEF